MKPEKEDGPLRTLHRDLLLPCGFLSQSEEEQPDRISKRQRPPTRQSVAQSETNDWIQENGDEFDYPFEPSQEMKETRFIKIYDTPILNPAKRKEEPGKSVTEPDKHLPEMSIGAPHSPERENETESKCPDVNHGKTTDESLVSEETDPEALNSFLDLPPSTPDDILTDVSDLPGMSSMQAESQEVVETEMRDQINEQPVTVTPNSNSDLSQPIRRSERTRQPAKRLDYPLLGNPLVTVVKSLFHGLSEAFIDSLNNNDMDYWSQSQAFEMTTPIVE